MVHTAWDKQGVAQDIDAQNLAKLHQVKLPEDWKWALKDILLSETMDNLRSFLRQQMASHTIYPVSTQIFSAFHHTALSDVRVVIVGQDPYHGANQAMGLSFSVPRIIPKPPSLQNILKELSQDMNIPMPNHGDLSAWARQGVLLLNSVLTVQAGKPNSHQGRGWEAFTDAVIDVVARHNAHTVFILWGAYAQKKGRFIDTTRHLVLTAAHPSPLSANRGGFFGTRPFSRANDYLARHGRKQIDWRL